MIGSGPITVAMETGGGGGCLPHERQDPEKKANKKMLDQETLPKGMTDIDILPPGNASSFKVSITLQNLAFTKRTF